MKLNLWVIIFSSLYTFSAFPSNISKTQEKQLKFSDNDTFYNEFFDDIELQNVFIQSGGQLVVKSGATLDVQVGAVAILNGVSFGATTFTGDVLVDPAAGSANAFRVFDVNNTPAFTVTTAVAEGGVIVRNALTLGTVSAPIIDVTTGPLQIFSPSAVSRFGASTANISVRGSMTITGDLFNPQFFEMQSGMKNLQAQMQMVNTKQQLLNQLEKKINTVNKEVSIIKEVKNSFPLGQDLTFEKDLWVKGNIINIDPSKKSKYDLISFAQESARPFVADSGMAYLKEGEATIELDPHYLDRVAIGEKTPFIIHLTPEGECNGLYVSSRTTSSFTVRELGRGHSSILFNWHVEAVKRGFEGTKYMTIEEYKNHSLNSSQ